LRGSQEQELEVSRNAAHCREVCRNLAWRLTSRTQICCCGHLTSGSGWRAHLLPSCMQTLAAVGPHTQRAASVPFPHSWSWVPRFHRRSAPQLRAQPRLLAGDGGDVFFSLRDRSLAHVLDATGLLSDSRIRHVETRRRMSEMRAVSGRGHTTV